MKILVINGPNLNLLGQREPGIYGKGTLKDLEKLILSAAERHGADVSIHQSNHEGEIVELIHMAFYEKFDGIIINPAAYTHTSVAILDALLAVSIPAVEVHISDINAREDFRRKSLTAPACIEQISGFGFKGYEMAMDVLLYKIRESHDKKKLLPQLIDGGNPMKVAVIGLGVVGGSFALGLKDNLNYEIYGVDNNPDVIKKAQSDGIISRGSTVAAEILPLADLSVICIYPNDIEKFTIENMEHFKPFSIVAELSGIKGFLISKIDPLVREDIDFFYTHPMAGREKKGLEFASSEVNKGANFLITKHGKNKDENKEKLERVLEDIGFGRVTYPTAAEHDKAIAYTSQLPHLIAVALMNSKSYSDDTGAFMGDSFKSITRIAAMNEELWAQLFLNNRADLMEALVNFERELASLHKILEEEDSDLLKEAFIKSTKRRESLN